MWITSNLNRVITPTAIALGNFDGVHRGHRQVIDPIVQVARGHPTVVSFHPHPQEFFSGETSALITPLAEKVEQLQELGVRQLVLLPFTPELVHLTPGEFVDKILLGHLKALHVSVGENFQFGYQRSGSAQDLMRLGQERGLGVVCVGLSTTPEGEVISSSRIRAALAIGDLEQACQLLGRPYTLRGWVVAGDGRGRELGFPTANLGLPHRKLLPRQGVYAIHASSPALTQGRPGVMNFGARPTVDGQGQRAEVHLFDWSGDLYGQALRVELIKFLRPERRFPSLGELKAQIHQDCLVARSILQLPYHETSACFPDR